MPTTRPYPRILIADDNPDVLESLRLLLKTEGYRTELANSPAGVLEAVRKQEFDALLVDLNYSRDTTSGQEGLELLAQLRAIPHPPPVIVMTAWGSVDLAVEAMQRGAQDFVLKPWENARLLGALKLQVTRHRLQRKRERLACELDRLGNRLAGASSASALLNSACEMLRSALETGPVTIFLKSGQDSAYLSIGDAGGIAKIVRGSGEGAATLRAAIDAVAHAGSGDPNGTAVGSRRLLESFDARIAVPLPMGAPERGEASAGGLITVGAKLDGEEFDAGEMEFLRASAETIARALREQQLREQAFEVEEARQIQSLMFPRELPSLPGCELHASWRPMCALGGDYFDAFELPDKRVAVCIADVMGKGLPAALLMSNLQAALRALAPHSASAMATCARVNRSLCENIPAGRFVTAFYCIFEPSSRRASYVNAGHNPPLLVRPGASPARLATGGPVLGLFPDAKWEQGDFELRPGDRLLLFTDGITEAANGRGEEFGEERLLATLSNCAGLAAPELHGRVLRAVAEFSGGGFQDDAALAVVAAE